MVSSQIHIFKSIYYMELILKIILESSHMGLNQGLHQL